MDAGVDRLEPLAQAATAMAGELDLNTVLETITRLAAQVTGARYAALGILGENGTITRFITHGANDETIRAIGHYPTGKGLLGLLIHEPRVLHLDNLGEHPASTGFPANHPPMKSFLGAPVRLGGRVYGNFYLTEKEGGFDAEDERVIVVLAAQAGATIENALLSARLQNLAVHEERDRISRDLHDGVIQSLFSIGLGLQSARALVGVDPLRVADRLDAAIDQLDATIRDLRNAIYQLRPHEAASMGLARGLAELAREYEVNALSRPILDVAADVDARVPVELVPDLLQMAREALSNAARHAGACRVTVCARADRQDVELSVTDDGAGFDSSQVSAGHGLENLQERATWIGAGLDINSRPGQGTRIRMTIPLKEEAE
jgi:signal transduction histidine kinase